MEEQMEIYPDVHIGDFDEILSDWGEETFSEIIQEFEAVEAENRSEMAPELGNTASVSVEPKVQASSDRFASLGANAVQDIVDGNLSKSTGRNTSWGVKIFRRSYCAVRMAETTYTNVKEGNTFLDHITEKGLDNKSIINRFDKVSGEYNEALRSVDFMGPRSLAGILAELHPSDRENVRVLDLAAGTGLVAIELKKKGFVSADGLEPSEGMLAEAKRNNLYGRYICDMVGENTFDIETDTYSAITMSALSLEIFKKLPVKALEEMARVVKPGGHILMTQYDFAFDSEVLKASLSNLEDRGVWKLIEMRPVPDFTKGKDGLVSVHQVLK